MEMDRSGRKERRVNLNEGECERAYLVRQDTQHWLGDRVIPVIMRDLPGRFAVLGIKI